jgi:glycosyltransferase involved in cell wall biosynthesis
VRRETNENYWFEVSEEMPLHILTVTDDFPPYIGGMATHAWELSKALAKLGHEVTVLTAAKLCRNPTRFLRTHQEREQGVHIVHVGAIGFFRRRQIDRSVARYILQAEQTARTAQQQTILHFHELHRPARFRWGTSLPIVWTNHSSDFLEEFEKAECHARLKEEMSQIDWITAPSVELGDKVAMLGYIKDRITYIPNAVDTEHFSPASDQSAGIGGKKVVLICARRFARKNGLHVYLDALDRLDNETLGKCILKFAGNPTEGNPYVDSLLERISALRSRVEVALLGQVTNAQMPSVYRSADISVLPSLMEATSITGLESMSCGLPLVATNVGGIPDLVEHGINGLLCPPNDAAALAANLELLINSPSKRRVMGTAGRQRAIERFSWPVIAERYVDVYRAAALKPNRSSDRDAHSPTNRAYR